MLLLLVGGGGYTIRNVARAWTYETAIALNQEIPNELPYNDYFEYYGPDFKLHISPSNMPNQNSSDYLDKIKVKLFDNLRMLPHVPGVQMQPIPDDGMDIDRVVDEDKDSDPDKRISQLQSDRRVADERELSDSEDEDGDNRRDQANFKQTSNKRKASSDAVNGTTVTQVTKVTESTVIVPNVATTENGSSNEIAPSASETIVTTTTTEEVTKIITAVDQNEGLTTAPDESAPADGMDTSETS
jgi:hypothetical protein